MVKLIYCFILFMTSFNLWADNFYPVGSSCTSLHLNKNRISAMCRATNGREYANDIEIRGVTNRDGMLTLENDMGVASNLEATCSDLEIDSDFVLGGRCSDSTGRFKWSSLNLEKVIFNYNGTLAYRSNGFLDFNKTCSNISLNTWPCYDNETYFCYDATVFADCTAENGKVYGTSIVLRGVNVANGILYFEKDTSVQTGFHRACEIFSVVDSTGLLAAVCPNNESKKKWTTLDLTKVIGNYNGVLAYREE